MSKASTEEVQAAASRVLESFALDADDSLANTSLRMDEPPTDDDETQEEMVKVLTAQCPSCGAETVAPMGAAGLVVETTCSACGAAFGIALPAGATDASDVPAAAPGVATNGTGTPRHDEEARSDEVAVSAAADLPALAPPPADVEAGAAHDDGADGNSEGAAHDDEAPSRPSEVPSDFEYEAPTPPPSALRAQESTSWGEASASTERTQIALLRLAACGSAQDVRTWTAHAADAELSMLIKEVREMQTSCHQADARLINLEVEIGLLRQGKLAAEVRDAHDRRHSFEESSLLRAALDESEARRTAAEAQQAALSAKLAQKDQELSSLTLALQQAILERKGVAESARGWPKK